MQLNTEKRRPTGEPRAWIELSNPQVSHLHTLTYFFKSLFYNALKTSYDTDSDNVTNNELSTMWNAVVVPYLRYYPEVYLQKIRKIL